MDETHLSGRCTRCGRPLDAGTAEGLCATCLLEAAATFTPDSLAAEAPTVLAEPGEKTPGDEGPPLGAGATFGPYRIGRLLGRGGMGEVYEAEHVETGRRLAIKLLRGRLHNADDRARFLLEGQLAASVSHPHTVYIFGSEEIAGRPVIAMELLPGGTLKDRVDAEGPLGVADAVAAVLDIIGGLDAAQASGILHRDIKPSNCFVDADGSVKVGDFGLSISTLARDVQVGSGFQGTPQFAPPEQLRGEPLDVRADIYAVGATLYYLLTARTPFDAPNLSALFEAITTTAARPIRALRPDLPAVLATVVHQCLARDPKERPGSYAELAELLRPFSAGGVRPAPFGLRVVAGLIDFAIVTLPISISNAWSLSNEFREGTQVNVDPWGSPLVFTYFFVAETLFGASIGKWLLGLRVRAVQGRLTWSRTAIRTLVFFTTGLLLSAITWIMGEREFEAYLATHPLALSAFLTGPFFVALMFVTARRANGLAGLHELASGTRVVTRSARLERRPSAVDAGPPIAPGARVPFRCGPFEVLGMLGAAGAGQLLAGFDPALRRRVWIHAVPRGTPPVEDARRDLGRLGRLHWLTGRRSPDENWDAYEAPDGSPLSEREDAADWTDVKAWLADLTKELAEAERNGTTPVLGLDRIWIRRDGHAVLLDFRAPGGEGKREEGNGTREDDGAVTPQALLKTVAARVSERLEVSTRDSRGPAPMPRSAVELLRRWSAGRVPSLDAARSELEAVMSSPDRVSRWRRAVPIALASVPAVVLVVGAVGILPQIDATLTPGRIEVFSLLEAIEPASGTTRSDPNREALEIYVAGRYGDQLRDPAFWSLATLQGSLRRYRGTADRVLAAHPDVTPEAFEAASSGVAGDLERIRENYETNVRDTVPRVRALIVMLMAGLGLGFPLVVSLVSALILPGGVMNRLLGLTVVTRSGHAIGRIRSTARVLAAWSPVLVWVVWLLPSPVDRSLAMTISPLVPLALVLAVMLAGAIWAVVKPERGLHDRLTGTWIVPR